jgi:hypothetical protein
MVPATIPGSRQLHFVTFSCYRRQTKFETTGGGSFPWEVGLCASHHEPRVAHPCVFCKGAAKEALHPARSRPQEPSLVPPGAPGLAAFARPGIPHSFLAALRSAINSSITAMPDRACFDRRRGLLLPFLRASLAASRLSLSRRIKSRTYSLGVAQSPEATRRST